MKFRCMKFRLKSDEIDAVLWTGTNIQEVSEFVAGVPLTPIKTTDSEDWPSLPLMEYSSGRCVGFNLRMNPPTVSIRTSDGDWSHTEVGGYIVRLGGQCYGWDRDVFERTFESVPP